MSTIRQALVQAYAAAGRRPRRRVTRPPKTPKLAERLYVNGLRGLVREANRRVLAALERDVRPLLDQKKPARADAAGDFLPGIRDILAQVFTEAAKAELMKQAWERLSISNANEMASVLGVNPAMFDVESRGAWEAWRAVNVDLISSIESQYLGEVQGLVTEAATTGRRWEELRDAIRGRYDVSDSRAELIAVDQVLKANSDLSRERMRRLGVTTYTWSTSQDERVRPDHARLEGETFTWDAPPVVNQSEVDKGRPARREPPGRDFRCRCVAIPVFEDDDG